MDRILFHPSWGSFDLAVGSTIPSVFGGPADRVSFGDTDDFTAQRVPAKKYSTDEKLLQSLYQKIRDLREENVRDENLADELFETLNTVTRSFPQDWLLLLECLELSLHRVSNQKIQEHLKSQIETTLKKMIEEKPHLKEIIQDGFALAQQAPEFRQ